MYDEMSEWSNVADSKSAVREIEPGVQIPLSSPKKIKTQKTRLKMQKEGQFAIFSYKKCDQDLIEGLDDFLNENAQKIFDFFEIEVPEQKVQINIIPTKKEYDESCKKSGFFKGQTEIPKWAVGNYCAENGQITYLSLHDFDSTSHKGRPEIEYKKTILHEFTHYVCDLFKQKHGCGPTIQYLSEGLACYLSGQTKYLSDKFDFTLDECLGKTQTYEPFYMLTKYLVENYDKEKVFQLIESNREAKEFLIDELYDKAKNYCNDCQEK